jgi:FMN phosphatase YigB (HAD superfamily)
VDSTRARRWYEERFLKGFIKMLGAHARIRPGLIDLLSLLKTRGVKLAVVSDYGCVEERLEAIGVPLDAFDDLAAAEDFGTLKPSSKPYIALADKWKLEPETLVLVGDREDIDEQSSVAAGMGFLGIRDNNKSKKQYSSWQEVAGDLESRTALLQERLNESI